MGRSETSGYWCASTAPTPTLDASHASIKVCFGLKWAKVGIDVINLFSSVQLPDRQWVMINLQLLIHRYFKVSTETNSPFNFGTTTIGVAHLAW